MTSMTGYSFVEKSFFEATISVEFKSVNSRFLDLSIYSPYFLNAFEGRIRETVSKKIARGKVDLNIRVKNIKNAAAVKANVEAAKNYYEEIKKIAEALGDDSKGFLSKDIPLSLIVSQAGVLETDDEIEKEKIWALLEPVLNESLEIFYADRVREGENLKKDLVEKLGTLEKCADFFAEWQPKMEGLFKEMLVSKFQELLGSSYDENRVMTETASLLVKYTINEEIIRLKSHLENLKKELEENPTPGKKIDFLCQEIGREINTIGSKNQFKEVGEMVINAKNALENIREQAKNVE